MSRVITSFDSVVLAAIASELEPLRGSRVARILQPAPDEIALTLRTGSEPVVLLCSIHPRWARVHVSAPVEGGGLSPFGQLLRARLDRARLTAVRQPLFERILTLAFEAVAGTVELQIEVMGRHSNLILVHDDTVVGSLKLVPHTKSSVRAVLPGQPYKPPPQDRPAPPSLTAETLAGLLRGSDDQVGPRLTAAVLGLSPPLAYELVVRAGLEPAKSAGAQLEHVPELWRALQDLTDLLRARRFSPTLYLDGAEPVGYSAFPFVHLRHWQSQTVSSMSEAVERVVAKRVSRGRVDEQRTALLSVIAAAAARLTRRRNELDQSLAEAAKAAVMQQHGELLLAYASQIPSGADRAMVPGFDGQPITIPLDPTRTPVENAQRLFRRYTKVKAASPAIEARRRETIEELAYLDSVRTLVDQAASADDVFDLRQELITARYVRERRIRARPGGKAKPSSGAPRPRTVTLPTGETVLVGRTNEENDRMTFKVATPKDLWLHARGVSGAHVILRTGGRPPTDAAIRQAAAIAAYYSEARDTSTAAVDFTERRYVSKPKGSRPGFVTYRNEKTVHVRPEIPQ